MNLIEKFKIIFFINKLLCLSSFSYDKKLQKIISESLWLLTVKYVWINFLQITAILSYIYLIFHFKEYTYGNDVNTTNFTYVLATFFILLPCVIIPKEFVKKRLLQIKIIEYISAIDLSITKQLQISTIKYCENYANLELFLVFVYYFGPLLPIYCIHVVTGSWLTLLQLLLLFIFGSILSACLIILFRVFSRILNLRFNSIQCYLNELNTNNNYYRNYNKYVLCLIIDSQLVKIISIINHLFGISLFTVLISGSGFIMVQIYFSHWAMIEIMKTINVSRYFYVYVCSIHIIPHIISIIMLAINGHNTIFTVSL